jgi:uncharacterized protein YcbX
VQVQAEYTLEPERLRLTFPDGGSVEGSPDLGRAIGTLVWGRRVRGHIVYGSWNDALSEFCGEPVFLVASDVPGQAYDEYPISILSQASDSWLGGTIQIGKELRLQLVARDPRCSITTQDPTTGERDIDTLRIIISYRPNPKAAYFGVYGIVEYPGAVSVGDAVSVHTIPV